MKKLKNEILEMLTVLFEELLIMLLIGAIMLVIALKMFQIGYHYVDGFWDETNKRIEQKREDPYYQIYYDDEE